MGIMTLQAIAHCRRMHRQSGQDLLLIVAAQAESLRSRSDQLDAGDVASDANFVAAQAASRDCRVDCLPFAFLLVALETLRGVYILLKWYGVGFCHSRRN